MYCSKCGMQNDSNNIFCQNCGEVLNKNSSMSMEENNTNINYQPQQETNYQPNEVKIENQNTFNTQQASQYSSDYNFNENKSKKIGVISLVLGIISLLTSLFCIISIPTGGLC